MDYRSLTESDVVAVYADGSVAAGTRRPTTEKAMHLAFYAARPEVGAIIHTHPVYSTAFACMGEAIPLITDEAAQCLGDVCRVAEYALPGTPELAANCAAALDKRANCCLLRSHGAVCVGKSMDKAFTVSRVLEATAQIYQLIRSMRGSYIPISWDNIEKMRYFSEHLYGQAQTPRA
jgi:L-fuculose-phosphate aldolase